MNHNILKAKIRAVLDAEEAAGCTWLQRVDANQGVGFPNAQLEQIRAAAILTLRDATRILGATTDLITYLEKR